MRWLCYCFIVLGFVCLRLLLRYHKSGEVTTWTLTKSEATYDSFRYHNCSSSTCLRSQPCMLDYRSISIYIQPILKIVDEEGTLLTPVPSREFHSIRSFLQMYSVPDPKEACLVFPGIDFLNLYRFPSIDVAHAIASMISERFYNVLIFTLVGQWKHGFRHILASSITPQRIYRHRLDISLPPFLVRRSVSPQSLMVEHRLVVPLFNASLSFQEESMKVFSGLKDVTLLTECFNQRSLVCDLTGNIVDWEDAFQKARFGLIHESMPHFKTALYRALEAAVIPVIFAPNYILPFFEYIDWHSIALFPSNLSRVVEVINSLSMSKIETMHEEIRSFFVRFSSLQGIVNMTVRVLESRMLPMKTRSLRRWNGLSEKPIVLPHFERAAQLLLLVESDSSRTSHTLHLMQKLASSRLISSITIIWRDLHIAPSIDKWRSAIPLEIVTGIGQLRDLRSVITQIKTDILLVVPLGVCSLDNSILKKAVNFFHIWRTCPDRAVVIPCFGSSLSAVIVHRMLLSLKTVDQQAVTNSTSLFGEILKVHPSLHVVMEDYTDG